jgi:c-di-GMP-related signal transduction protein
MKKSIVARQPILNEDKEVFGFDICFRNSSNDILNSEKTNMFNIGW